MTVPTHPGERPGLRAVLPTTLKTAVPAIGTVVGMVVTVVPPDARVLFASGGGTLAVLLSTAVGVAAKHRVSARFLRGQLHDARREIERLLQDRNRMQADSDWALKRQTDEAAQARQRLADDLEQVRRHSAQLAEQVRHAEAEKAKTISATAGAAARLQASANALLADLRAMEEKHADDEVLADLFHLDHRTAQAGRLADSVAVLSGARSGRRWARPIPMQSIVRGALGRVGGYQRVRVHSGSETAVVGHAAEGVMHVLAELIDNAANFSPPTSEVHVYVEEVPAGVLVSVEDSGLVMSDVQLRRAEKAVAGDITELGGLTGTRLGLAVVGLLARKHSLKVSFRPSARGGTGVLVLLPQDILTTADAVPSTQPAPEPRHRDDDRTVTAGKPASAQSVALAATRPRAESEPARPAPHVATDAAADAATEGNAATGGLPRRRRGRTLAAAERSRAMSSQQTRERTASADIVSTAARFSSFRQAARGEAAEPRSADASSPAPSTASRGAEVPPGSSPST